MPLFCHKCQQNLVPNNSRDNKRHIETLERLENRIREQETAIQSLSRELEKAGEDNTTRQELVYEHIQKISWKVAQAQAKPDVLMLEWEQLAT